MRLLLLYVVPIILIVILYIATTNPVAQNYVTQFLPSLRKAEQPPVNVLKKKEGNQIGKVLTKTYKRTFSKREIDTYNYSFYVASGNMKAAKYEVDHYTVTYNTTDEKNILMVNTAQLYIPKTDTEMSFPIYVFGSGTTGIDDNCAPSREIVDKDNWGDYRAHMLSYASQGYIVVFPDYEGFNDGTSRIHHYFHKLYEGHIMLDSARAAYDFFADSTLASTPQEAVFFSGYSQGGHAAFAASDLAKTYAPEIPIKGIIGYAPTTNVLRLMKESPHLAAYIVVAYQDTYGKNVVNEKDILQDKWLPTLFSDAITKCITEVSNYYPPVGQQIYKKVFLESLQQDLQTGNYEAFREALERNSTGLTKTDVPALVLQGGADPIVTNDTQEKFIRASCQAGNIITYRNYPGVHHFQTRQVSFHDTLQWMKERLEGKTVENNCKV